MQTTRYFELRQIKKECDAKLPEEQTPVEKAYVTLYDIFVKGAKDEEVVEARRWL